MLHPGWLLADIYLLICCLLAFFLLHFCCLFASYLLLICFSFASYFLPICFLFASYFRLSCFQCASSVLPACFQSASSLFLACFQLTSFLLWSGEDDEGKVSAILFSSPQPPEKNWMITLIGSCCTYRTRMHFYRPIDLDIRVFRPNILKLANFQMKMMHFLHRCISTDSTTQVHVVPQRY